MKKAKPDSSRELRKEYGRLLKKHLPSVYKMQKVTFTEWLTSLGLPILILFLGCFLATQVQAEKPSNIRVVPFDPSHLAQPPITNAMPKIRVLQPSIAPPAAAKPIAVQDEVAGEKEEATIPSQEEYALLTPTANDTSLFGDNVVLIPEFEPEDIIPPSDTFIPFRVPPQVIVEIKPGFPEMAKIAGASAKVWIKVFVDEKGDVRAWEIVKVTPEKWAKKYGFEEEVIKIIWKWKFTPAIQQNFPVGVWIAFPFNFEFKK